MILKIIDGLLWHHIHGKHYSNDLRHLSDTFISSNDYSYLIVNEHFFSGFYWKLVLFMMLYLPALSRCYYESKLMVILSIEKSI